LAHTIAHGVLTKTLTFDARWIFDTVAILQRAASLDISRFVEFANRLAAPQRIRDALTSIAGEVPESIPIDRALVGDLRDAVHSNSRIVSWLYTQTPTPNIGEENLSCTPRLDRIKAMLIHFIWLPMYLRKRQGLSLLSYFQWLDAFPPVTKSQAALRLFIKICVRGPVLLYRLTLQK